MHRSAIALSALLLSASALDAQQRGIAPIASDSIVLRSGTLAEAQHHLLDWATGEIRPLAGPPPGVQLGPDVDCFTNDASPGNSSHPDHVQELVDWGVKSCGASGLVSSFTFGYRTDCALTRCSVAFYAGTTGFASLGTQVRRFAFQGLPGGFNAVHFITVDVRSDPLVLPDGPIGWSFTNDDGPFCAGSILAYAPDFQLGTEDALDVYDLPPAPSGIYTGTFNFGPGTHVGSLWMTIDEDDGTQPAATAMRFGSGINPSVFFPLSAPRIGTAWRTTIDVSSTPAAVATVMALSRAPSVPFVSGFGEVLIDLGPALILQDLAVIGLHGVNLPLDLTLVGTTFYAQGAVFAPGALQLTNGIDITLGF
jgi:hypothetical protein